MADVCDVRGAVFWTSSKIAGDRLSSQLAGCLDMETTPQLRGFLDQLTQDLSGGVVQNFEFDTAQLYLMSSSAISCFATWVKHVKDMSPETRVRFVTNPNLAWQRRTLAAIRKMAEQIVTVE